MFLDSATEQIDVASTILDMSSNSTQPNIKNVNDINNINEGIKDEDAFLILSAVKNISNNNDSDKNSVSESNQEYDNSTPQFDIKVTSPGPYLTSNEFVQIYEKILYDINLRGEQLRKYKSGTAEVYGEALPELVNMIIKKLDIKSTDVVYDIGSGIGNVVVQMSAQTGCKSYGVEIRSDLHEIALKINEHMKEEMKKVNKTGFGEVILINGDALEQPTLLVDTTIVFLNNVCYPDNMQHALEHFFLETLKHGTRVVTVKELFPRTRPTSERFTKSFATLFKYPCEQYITEPGVVSWKASGVTLNIYTVDREFWNRMNNKPFWTTDLFTQKKKKKAPKANHYNNEELILFKDYIGESIYDDKINELKNLHNQNINKLNNQYSLVILSHNDSSFYINKIKSNKNIPLFIQNQKDNSFKEIKYNIIDKSIREINKRAKKEREENIKKIKEMVQKYINVEEEIMKNQILIEEYKKKIKESEENIKEISLKRENILVDLSLSKSEVSDDQYSKILSDFELSNNDKDLLISLKNKKRKMPNEKNFNKMTRKRNKVV